MCCFAACEARGAGGKGGGTVNEPKGAFSKGQKTFCSWLRGGPIENKKVHLDFLTAAATAHETDIVCLTLSLMKKPFVCNKQAKNLPPSNVLLLPLPSLYFSPLSILVYAHKITTTCVDARRSFMAKRRKGRRMKEGESDISPNRDTRQKGLAGNVTWKSGNVTNRKCDMKIRKCDMEIWKCDIGHFQPNLT